ncbi:MULTISPECIES: polyprenyl synthetase family protein [unclassified Staphylococcus]|uniref:polyprenyl synthetase family protein n=1 Tax=unclassified Staphylococcus TaxID=91994 RepID=UPI001882A80A|nr:MULTISPECIES: farnesyl diphosphate synthase [unclassified Staphylococcus]MBF2757172.1 polyprenyl synthetase family protein [Staphylococcus haemolyticus]MBF2772599.1 polyprenyl synthetase family protein [Staphylococcus haemolyticus]MBF2776662.1 polyprenyl synthetase family protein [Staphylococcus haemolyticus]MBF2816312.1 polyprenyl synthetase family protein [Staphylococcus haemolyticus]MBF9720469.1 polyprenyl synthetase family protein [Staphylococcus haemolyticus]
MTKMSMNELIEQINSALDGVIKPSPLNTNLEESMQYSLNAGGKRIRPLLVFLTLDVLNQDYIKGKQTALALEMIHTYSLIHDDLPPMDNDDYRRGKLTNHKVYGEWKAILAGDALLTKAFEIVADDELLEPEVKVKVLSRLAHNSGHLGMVGGQTLDMQSEDKPVDLETLEQIHKAKTGALLKFAILSAADIAKVDQSTSQLLESFSDHLGLMFQIKDDLLDVYGDESKLGKKVGSDIENHKSTYVSLLGKKGAEDKLDFHKNAATESIKKLSEQYDIKPLLDVVDLFYTRDH